MLNLFLFLAAMGVSLRAGGIFAAAFVAVLWAVFFGGI